MHVFVFRAGDVIFNINSQRVPFCPADQGQYHLGNLVFYVEVKAQLLIILINNGAVAIRETNYQLKPFACYFIT